LRLGLRETPCAEVGAALQHEAIVVFHATSLEPPAHGAFVVAGQQPSPHSPAEHASTGIAVPKRAIQTTSQVVSRRAKCIRPGMRPNRQTLGQRQSSVKAGGAHQPAFPAICLCGVRFRRPVRSLISIGHPIQCRPAFRAIGRNPREATSAVTNTGRKRVIAGGPRCAGSLIPWDARKHLASAPWACARR
jgi:hypothetical protein